MANLIANTSGNLSAASFGTTETATGAFNFPTGTIATTNSTTISTSETFSPTFTTTNLNVCDGVLLHCYAGSGATGTFTVALNNGTTDLGTCTINASDLPTTVTNVAPVFFKFGSTVTLNGAATWKIGVKCSVANQVTVIRASVTAGDWYRALRLTTAATAASNDHLYICKELTGAATGNALTVTMDYTANTIAPGQVDIGWLGTLAYGTAASTNYYLQLNGLCYVWNGGTLTMGTSGTPMPSTSTAILEFNCTANVQYGLECLALSTVNTYGGSKFWMTHLAADVAAAATSLTTADDTSATWAVGDTIVIAPTTQTNTQVDAKTISTISGTAITCPALGFAHTGTIFTSAFGTTFDMRAEIINVTRNVKVRGISTTFQAYININAAATVNCQNTEFYQLGSVTALKRGIDIGTTTGSCTFNGCAFHDYVVASSIGLNCNATTNNNFTLTNNVSYNIAATHISVAGATLTSNWTISNCVGILTTSTSTLMSLTSIAGSISNIIATGGGGHGVDLSGGGNTATSSVSNIVSHSNNQYGLNLSNCVGLTVSNLTLWRNITAAGLIASSSFDCTLSSGQAWGNNGTGILLNQACYNLTFNNWTMDKGGFVGDPLNTQGTQVGLGGGGSGNTCTSTWNNCNFGQSYPATNTFNCGTFGGILVAMNCNTSENLCGTQSSMGTTSHIGYQNLNGAAGNHRSYYKRGFISLDTTIYDVSPSQRMTPNGGTGKILQSAPFSCGVISGNTATPAIKVRCSATGAGDSTSYNGAAPALYVVQNIAAGISADTLLATLPASYLPGGVNQGAWGTLTAASPTVTEDCVLSFYVAVDGSTGWINVDTASVA